MRDPRPAFLRDLDPEVVDRVRRSRREAIATAVRAGLGTAVVGSLPVTFALSARDAFGQAAPAQVADALNFALLLEYLEDEFYKAGRASLVLSTQFAAHDQASLGVISRHETAHVRVLRAAISAVGGTPVAKPSFDFTAKGTQPTALTLRNAFLGLALAFEDLGVRAYKGQVPSLVGASSVNVSNVGTVSPLTLAMQIHGIEARHAAAIRRLLPAPNAPKGWITADQGVPAPVYTGEANLVQGGVNAAAIGQAAGFTTLQVTEAFDEPLTKEQVLAIVTPFLG